MCVAYSGPPDRRCRQRTVPEIIEHCGLDRDESIELFCSLIIHRMIEPPDEIKYPKLENLFYPTL